MAQPKQPLYGGQAVIEGVMFVGQRTRVTAIRRKDQEIEFFEETDIKTPLWLKWLQKIPFIRGIVAILTAVAGGSKHMEFASERFDADTDGETEERPSSPASSKWAAVASIAAIAILSFIAGKIIFTAVPAFLASVFDPWVHNYFLRNIIEGAIKTALLLVYLWTIGQMPIIKRLFQYHGAEHKVINAFEAGDPLTVEHVRQHSRFHYRCGSSFLVFTILTGVILYSFIPYSSVWERVLDRIVLLPVVIGVSYEVLRLTNACRNIPLLSWLAYPGLWLQALTTREPDDDQIEVSIAAFQRMRELDKRDTIEKVW
nr:DUF1385 domain-containing protein [Bacillota bacterium]